MMKPQEDRIAGGCFLLHHRSRRAKPFLNFVGHVITSSHALSSNFFPHTPITINRP